MSVISRSTSPSEGSIFSFSSDLDGPTDYRIHVAFLPQGFSEEQLRDLFEDFGTIMEVWVASASTFGFVVFKNKDEAQAAIDEMDGKTYQSKRLKVTWARPRTRNRVQTNDPRVRCYKCGQSGHFSRECQMRMTPMHALPHREYPHSSIKPRHRSRSRSPCRNHSTVSMRNHYYYNVPVNSWHSVCRGICCQPINHCHTYDEPCRSCEMSMMHKPPHHHCHHHR